MKLEFGKIMRSIREENKWSLEEMAQKLGTTKQALSKYERGERTPKITVAAKFASILGIPLEELAGADDFLPSNVVRITESNITKIPLIGSVAAGQPILADESYDVFVDSPVKADYALRVTGDSMEPTYYSDDILYIRQTPDVPDGKIAIVLIDDEACVKHVYHIPNGVMLTSDNPAYQPMTFTWPEHDTIRVLGAVVGFTRMYK